MYPIAIKCLVLNNVSMLAKLYYQKPEVGRNRGETVIKESKLDNEVLGPDTETL